MPFPIIGQREFTDGSQRAVYSDSDGRQFVLDDGGKRVYGVWLVPEDEPVILGREEIQSGTSTSNTTRCWSGSAGGSNQRR